MNGSIHMALCMLNECTYQMMPVLISGINSGPTKWPRIYAEKKYVFCPRAWKGCLWQCRRPSKARCHNSQSDSTHHGCHSATKCPRWMPAGKNVQRSSSSSESSTKTQDEEGKRVDARNRLPMDAVHCSVSNKQCLHHWTAFSCH